MRQSQAPYYRRTAIHWVMSAKKAATRNSRLHSLITDSANQVRIKPLRRNND
ncbi:MAG: YdeI/OmpD-associated family protein [Cyclobacteriaceae bacterium]|nr:YdeI/OmpD-associated family protein [Cyclobacteriaceae bacterium]